MSAQQDFQPVFEALKDVLKPFESSMVVQADEPGNYSLNAPYEFRGRPLYFGGVRIRKNYVSFHLMPVYMFPDLLKEISPELRRRMQGKSCFNFKTVEPEQLKELARLAKRGASRFKKEKVPK